MGEITETIVEWVVITVWVFVVLTAAALLTVSLLGVLS